MYRKLRKNAPVIVKKNDSSHKYFEVSFKTNILKISNLKV